mmetsp:Transcript_96544/g.170668  ORF Transcript_96544/g.170668 Transcript_96544/m.170668 type:complete len:297 (+) Transcript_96544:67-957(+)
MMPESALCKLNPAKEFNVSVPHLCVTPATSFDCSGASSLTFSASKKSSLFRLAASFIRICSAADVSLGSGSAAAGSSCGTASATAGSSLGTGSAAAVSSFGAGSTAGSASCAGSAAGGSACTTSTAGGSSCAGSATVGFSSVTGSAAGGSSFASVSAGGSASAGSSLISGSGGSSLTGCIGAGSSSSTGSIGVGSSSDASAGSAVDSWTEWPTPFSMGGKGRSSSSSSSSDDSTTASFFGANVSAGTATTCFSAGSTDRQHSIVARRRLTECLRGSNLHFQTGCTGLCLCLSQDLT